MGRFLALVIALALLAPPAVADPGSCARTFRKESANFARAAREAIEDCEADVRLGALPATTDCRSESGATVAIATAAEIGRAHV